MADRAVYSTGEDDEGDITSLCNSRETWSPRTKVDAIADIAAGLHRYRAVERVVRKPTLESSTERRGGPPSPQLDITAAHRAPRLINTKDRRTGRADAG